MTSATSPVLCVVSDRFRFICLLIAKNATSTLRAEFGRGAYEGYERRYVEIDAAVRDDYFTFAVLREPVSRLLSAYQEISMRIEWGASPDTGRRFQRMEDTPERFATFLEELDDARWDPHIRRQVEYLSGVRVDAYVRLERFQGGLETVFRHLGMGPCPAFPKRRSREDRKIVHGYGRFLLSREDLDERALSRIARVYDADLRLYAALFPADATGGGAATGSRA